MVDASVQVLQEAIARNAGIVLSLPMGGALRHHKSRFLAADEQGFWVQSVPAEIALIRDLIARQANCGISFKSGLVKLIFASPIQRLEERFTGRAKTTSNAILLRHPEQIKAIQRRSSYRVQIAEQATLVAVRIWRIGKRAELRDTPMVAQEVIAGLRDLSIGGIGVILTGMGDHPPRISPEDRLRIELIYDGNTLLLEGRLRYPNASIRERMVRAGVEFKKLQDDVEGRQKLAQLNRLVGELQRDEVRRIRLGVTVNS